MGEWLGGGGWVYSVQHPTPGREEWRGLFPCESDVLAERAAKAHNNLRAERDEWRRMYETEKAALESVALRADQLAKECDAAQARVAELEAELQHTIVLSDLGDAERIKVEP